MRAQWFVLPVALAFLMFLPARATAQERPGGKALERIRNALHKMKAEGKSDIEILRALRDMADRALAQQSKQGARGGDRNSVVMPRQLVYG